MGFASLSFLVLVVVAFVLYWAQRSVVWQNIILVLASVVFYAFFDWRFLGLLGLMVVVPYVLGFAAERGSRVSVACGVVACVSALVFFKYFNFFVESFSNGLSLLGVRVAKFELQILLPVGISFFTFQAIAYLIDVYQKRIPSEKNLLNYAAFACFFPQLVAGPIGRAPKLLPQYEKIRVFDEALAVEGCRQILWGAFAKYVVADNCQLIASTLLNCKLANAGMVWVGALAYLIQIYGDFSGYSNMAVGLGKLFGIRLQQNFAYPYFASSFGDFWRRWHISLTTWFRDYVYIPLGGSRCSLGKNLRNVWIVFLLSGLWHGAAWTFVVWGGIHAFFLSIEKIRKAGWVLMLVGAMLAWLVFQAPDIGEVVRYYKTMLGNFGSAVWPRVPMSCYLIAFVSSILLFGTEYCSRNKEFGLMALPRKRVFRWSVYLILALMVVCCSGKEGTFIYSQF